MKYRLVVPPLVEKNLVYFPPNLKKKIRSALETIQEDPYLGKALKDELKGLWSYPVSRYRVVYRIEHDSKRIQVIDIAPRNVIYSQILEGIRKGKKESE